MTELLKQTSNPYFFGLDLGQAKDFTALAVIERQGYHREAELHVRHLQRWPLGTSYLDIVQDVNLMLHHPAFAQKGVTLAADATGVGQGVMDILRQANLKAQLRPIMITGGSEVTREKGSDVTKVPKRDLVAIVQAGLQCGRLKVADGLPEAVTLQREMQNFQIKISVHAHDSYGAWREGSHDDLLLAVALGVWVAEENVDQSWLGFFAGAGVKTKMPGDSGGHSISSNQNSGIFPKRGIKL